MKKLEIIGYSIFLIGLMEKILHTRFIPFPAYIMMFGIAFILVINLFRLITKKSDTKELITGFSSVIWLVLLLFIVKYWILILGYYYTSAFLIAAVAISAVSLFFVYKTKEFTFRTILMLRKMYFSGTDIHGG